MLSFPGITIYPRRDILCSLPLCRVNRSLYLHHREDEAFALLAKYHGNGDADNPIVRLEVEEFRENIRQDASDKRWWDFRSVKAAFFCSPLGDFYS